MLQTLPRPIAAPALSGELSMWAVVFAGGIGSRFWPLSSRQRPKPVLRLLGERSLVADAIHRLAPLVPLERVLVLTVDDVATAVRAAIPDIPAHNVLIEPKPLGTAASLKWALETIRSRGGSSHLVSAIHADIASAFPNQFRRGLERAATVVKEQRVIATLGVVPTRPETMFGYAVPGEPYDGAVPVHLGGACRVTRFVEKPQLDGVTELLSNGALWHAGVIVGECAQMEKELQTHASEIAAGGRPISIERGLLERTKNIAVVPVECGWDDVGTWASLRRARDLDDDGNGGIGDAVFVDSTSNVVHSESGTVVLFGCQQMLVVTLNGVTFVTPLEKAADLWPLLDNLPPHLRTISSSTSTDPNTV